MTHALNKKNTLAIIIGTALLAGCGGSDGGGSSTGGNGNGSGNGGSTVEGQYEPIIKTEMVDIESDVTFYDGTDQDLIANSSVQFVNAKYNSDMNTFHYYGSAIYLHKDGVVNSDENNIATLLTEVDRWFNDSVGLWTLNDNEDELRDLLYYQDIDTMNLNDSLAYEAYQFEIGNDRGYYTAETLETFLAYADSNPQSGYGEYSIQRFDDLSVTAESYLSDLKYSLAFAHIELGSIANSVAQVPESSLLHFMEYCDYLSGTNLGGACSDQYMAEKITMFYGQNIETDRGIGFYSDGTFAQGGWPKASYQDGLIKLPSDLYDMDVPLHEFDSLIIKHEIQHMLEDMMGYVSENVGWFKEGLAVTFSNQSIETWSNLANMSQSSVDDIFENRFNTIYASYNQVGAIFNYLLIDTDSEEARQKHIKMIKFIASTKELGLNDYEGTVEKFNDAQFEDHNGNVLTYDEYRRNLTTLVSELSSQGNVSQYKSYAYPTANQ